MKPFEKITDNEKRIMEYWIDNYAVESTPRTADIEHILREWNDKKQSLFDIFGGNLILERPITYEQGTDDVEMNIRKIFDSYSDTYNEKAKTFRNAFWSLTEGNDNNIFYQRNYIDEFGNKNPDFWSYSMLIDNSYLATNRYDSTHTIEFPLADGTKYKVQKGTKIMKVLAKVAESYNLPNFEDFRIAVSMATNKKTFKGVLCLSIHPFDYMTMSDNENSWSSCMSWKTHGCYRQGTVEMMNSSMAIVAYLKNDRKMIIPTTEEIISWPSKRWRCLILADDDIITSVKGYPYQSYKLTNECVKWVKELMESHTDSRYTDFCDDWTYNGWDSEITNNDDFSFYPETDNMYNDFYNDPYIICCHNEDLPNNYTYTFNYSGASECMCCGQLYPELEGTDDEGCEGFLVGTCCEHRLYCTCCGERLTGDNYQVINGEYFCNDCAEKRIIEPLDYPGTVFDQRCSDKIYIVKDTIPDNLSENSDTIEVLKFKEPFYVYDAGNIANFFDISKIHAVYDTITYKTYDVISLENVKDTFFNEYSEKNYLTNYLTRDTFSEIPDFEFCYIKETRWRLI